MRRISAWFIGCVASGIAAGTLDIPLGAAIVASGGAALLVTLFVEPWKANTRGRYE